MIRNPSDVIDTLRRESPGTLSLDALCRGLRSRGSKGGSSRTRLRDHIRKATSTLRILEFPDSPQGDGFEPALDAWVLVTSDEVAPDAEPLVLSVWDTLRLLATDVDVDSRVSLSRWMLKANEAVGLFRLLRRQRPPPTTPLARPP
ncbi:MAG: hypothetical protein OEO23_14410 [Gemmatimonadota bacterium]|nr:hypothetical protein [Gemmatimonadota bacterium]